MEIDSLVKKIKEDAEKEAAEIIRKAEEEAKEITEKIQKKADAAAEELFQQEAVRLNQETNRILSAERLAGRKELLAEKQRILETIYEEALRRLEKNPEMVRTFYRNNLNRLEKGSYQMTVASKLAKILNPDWIKKVSQELQKSERQLEFVGYQSNLTEGVRLTTGKTELFFSPQTTGALLRPELETELVKHLFADENLS